MTEKQKEKKFSACFEGMSCTEMMGKMMEGQAVGSLCAEMMQKITDRQETGNHFNCAEMMAKMMTMCSQLQNEEQKASQDQDLATQDP